MNAEPGRDELDRLRCPKLGCKAVIRGLTGLDELVKLRKHLARKHGIEIDTMGALELRADLEKTAKDM